MQEEDAERVFGTESYAMAVRQGSPFFNNITYNT